MTDEKTAQGASADAPEGHGYFAEHLMTLPRFLGLLPQLRPRVTAQWLTSSPA